MTPAAALQDGKRCENCNFFYAQDAVRGLCKWGEDVVADQPIWAERPQIMLKDEGHKCRAWERIEL